MQKTPTLPILVVDDDEAIARLVGTFLRRLGYAADWVTDADAALDAVRRQPYELLVTDYELAGITGLELGRQLRAEMRRSIPVILMTAHGSLETALAAMRAGASDFIAKPFELTGLQLVVSRVLQHHFTALELAQLRTEVRRAGQTHGLLGEHPSMERLRQSVERLGPAGGTVLVTGESGTGKELVARALHALGPRPAGPLVAVNCGALPATLLESELFGHVRGAFTDARSDRPGVFREADGGTIFLDEVGEVPLALQPALLRVLQERTVRPVGANREVAVDVRVVAATNRDLHAEVEKGAFRADLLFRLDVLHVEVPPLRARGEDLVLLLHHFLALASARHDRQPFSISPEAMALLRGHAWPGNVRELQNAVEGAVLSCDGPRLEGWHLPRALSPRPASRLAQGWPPVSLAELERRHIGFVLGAVGGNKQRAADLLGIDRVTLYRKLKRTLSK